MRRYLRCVTTVVTLSKLSVAHRDHRRSLWLMCPCPACRLLTTHSWLIAAAAGCAQYVWPVGRSRRARTARRGGLQVNTVVSERISGRRSTTATGEDCIRAWSAAEEAPSRRRTHDRSPSCPGVLLPRLQIGRLSDRDRTTSASYKLERHFSHASLQGKPRLYFVKGIILLMTAVVWVVWL